ncbi:multiple inositol polyphosphate phosphatase 1 [Plakobranchus ocellatus]|uniref:Multiple inositol polyphosphate phosphatase 1 n=1 Tax=Plakobranchus ocellatus TaxID=259542 RepID=A0AAV4CN76_9GAST|nr:multiple inositol polyphosphate phosphatase 1 [Plakobranchus ocellatus]
MAATMDTSRNSILRSRVLKSCVFVLWFIASVIPLTFSITSKHFSAKTPYNWVHSTGEVSQDEWYTMEDLKGMACNAVHASAVIRHGARYPGLEDVNNLINVHHRLVNAMEPDVNPGIYEWVNRFPSNNDKALHHLGEEEQEELGKRIATRLYTLFVDEDLTDFRFIVSSMQRTKDSAGAFYEGFSNVIHTEEDIDDEFDSEVNEELMRFFDLCAKYVYSVGQNKTAYKEYHDFLEGSEIAAVKARIYEKLGIKDDILKPAEIRLIYLACGYETAAFKSSPWCSVLEDDDMEILEYLGDIRHSIKNGYTHNITWQQSCPLLSEIFFGFDETIVEIESTEEDEEVGGFIVGQFAFGHAETVGPLYAILGLYNDSVPIKADNRKEQEHRLFRASKILPFSANAVFVLYECVPEEFKEHEEVDEAEYYLKLFVNEKPVRIPGCENIHCLYSEVRNRYSHYIDRCDFKQICKKAPPKDEL